MGGNQFMSKATMAKEVISVDSAGLSVQVLGFHGKETLVLAESLRSSSTMTVPRVPW